jgi:hypothetical protein
MFVVAVVLNVLVTSAQHSFEWQLCAVELSDACGRSWPIPADGLALVRK